LGRPFRAWVVGLTKTQADGLGWSYIAPLALASKALFLGLFERNETRRRKTHSRSKKMWVMTRVETAGYGQMRLWRIGKPMGLMQHQGEFFA
jgi:hypothetical protein